MSGICGVGGVELSGGEGRIVQGLRGKCPEAGEQTVKGSGDELYGGP